MARQFEDIKAVRSQVPLLIGIMGPSGGGKTFSALRLASGVKRIVGGETFVIDTESRRSLHYADQFDFRHVAFEAPFSPLDYLQAVDYCISKGAKTIVIDSQSHEHEGPGGVLEMHEAEVQRLSRGDETKANAVKMLAWSRPKQERRRYLNSLLQRQCNFIFCFRAKEKVKPDKSEKSGVAELGFMPIAGEEFLYEMTVNFLLLPGANGEPTWQTKMSGEKAMIKLPKQFRSIFTGGSLAEDHGEAMAKWALGDAGPSIGATAAILLDHIAGAETTDMLEELKRRANEQRAKMSAADRAALKAAFEERFDAIKPERQPGDDEV